MSGETGDAVVPSEADRWAPYRITLVERDRLDDWLDFVEGDKENRRRALPEGMDAAPSVQRFVVSDRSGAVVRFATEPTFKGLEAYTPTAMPCAEPERVRSALTHTAGHLATLPGPAKPHFVESALRGASDIEADWEAALCHAGFRFVTEKRLWTRPAVGGRTDAPIPDALPLSIFTETSSDLERCFVEIIDRTVDRTDQVERPFGVAINEFDWGLSVERNGELAGFGVFIAAEREGEAWVKFVGVRPRYAGQGIASQILHEGIAELARRGVHRILSLIDDVNTPSIALHQRFGFQPEARSVRTFYRVHGDTP